MKRLPVTDEVLNQLAKFGITSPEQLQGVLADEESREHVRKLFPERAEIVDNLLGALAEIGVAPDLLPEEPSVPSGVYSPDTKKPCDSE